MSIERIEPTQGRLESAERDDVVRVREEQALELMERCAGTPEKMILDEARKSERRNTGALHRIRTEYEREASRHFEKPKEAILSYPVEVIEDCATLEERRELYSRLPLEEMMEQQRFDLLNAKIEEMSATERTDFISTEGQSQGMQPLFDRFTETIQALIADRRYERAEQLLHARENILGPLSLSVSQEIKNLLAEAKQSNPVPLISREQLDFVDGESLDTPTGMVDFYLDEYARMALATLKRAPDFRSRASTSLTMMVAGMEDSLNTHVRMLATRMRRYLVFAVISELSHQNHSGLSCFGLETNQVHNLNRQWLTSLFVTPEDVLNFLAAARERFISAYHSEYYGGKSWSCIAQVAYDLWKTDDAATLVPMIDRVFQLQHNTGTVLNKDNEEFSRSDYTHEILDMKFESVSLNDLISRMNRWASKYVAQDNLELKKQIEDHINELNVLLKVAQSTFPQEVEQVHQQMNTSLVTENEKKNREGDLDDADDNYDTSDDDFWDEF